MGFPVIKGVSYVLAHVPDLVYYGSKPVREFIKDTTLREQIKLNLRTYEQAKNYPPHQVYIGNLRPEKLWEIERPWLKTFSKTAREIVFGEKLCLRTNSLVF